MIRAFAAGWKSLRLRPWPRRPAKPSVLRDRRGMAALEFALVFLPVIMVTMGAVEMGLMATVDSTMEIAVRTASRTASITAVGTEAQRQAMIESIVTSLLERWLPTTRDTGAIIIGTYVYPALNNVNDPTWIDYNGNGVCDVGEGTCTGAKLTPGVGVSGSLVLYTITLTRPGFSGILALAGITKLTFSRQTVVLNE